MDVAVAGGYREAVAVDVRQLPAEAERLADLTAVERQILTHLRDGLGAEAIAGRLGLSEADVYRAIADLLDAVDYPAPRASGADIHARTATRPATESEIDDFHRRFGPFPADDEG